MSEPASIKEERLYRYRSHCFPREIINTRVNFEKRRLERSGDKKGTRSFKRRKRRLENNDF